MVTATLLIGLKYSDMVVGSTAELMKGREIQVFVFHLIRNENTCFQLVFISTGTFQMAM